MRIRIRSDVFDTKIYDADSGEEITTDLAAVVWKWTPKGVSCQVALAGVNFDATARVARATVDSPGQYNRNGPIQAAFTEVVPDEDLDGEVGDDLVAEVDELVPVEVLALPSPNGSGELGEL